MKLLSEILTSTEVLSFTASDQVQITGLTYDSRRVSKGDCFFAVRGTQSDGHNYIGKAIEAGAAVIVCEQLPEQLNPAVSYVVVKDTNAAMADIAAAYYDKAFANHPNILIPVRDTKSTHVFHQYTLRLVDVNRDALREALAEKGIPAMIYYPIPLHMQKAYQDARYQTGDFPVAEKLAACVLSLPMHTELDDEQLEYITTHVIQAINAQH